MLTKLTIRQAADGLRKKEFSARELLEAHIKEIEEKNKSLNAFILKTFDQAREKAEEIDQDLAAGRELGVLAGLPVSIKDCFCIKGIESTSCSKILKGYIPPFDATSVKKIKKQGAVILGKVNTDEFTMGASTETSAFGVTKNPYDLERVAGGSSGGSAASVSAGMAMYSLATDTGGSIRQPAAFCGVVGLKVTYGRVSRYGVMSMASSLDTIGVLARQVEDVAFVLKEIAGQDKNDATTPPVEVDDYVKFLGSDLKGLKVGLPKEFFPETLNPEVKKIVQKAAEDLKAAGAEVKEISLPYSEYAIAVYYIIVPSEVSSNMARYDGVRYGFSVAKEKAGEVKDLVDLYKKNRSLGFGAEVKRRIMIGTYALSAGYYDAYYKKAMQVRTLIKKGFDQAFADVDIILAPVTPNPAFKIGENTSDPLQMYLEDMFTAPINLAGVPALSLPYGKIGHLPVGVQLIGRHFDEKTILRVGKKLEEIRGDFA